MVVFAESTRNISPPTRAVKVQALKVGRPGTSSRTRVSAQSLRNVMTDSMKEHLIASTKKLSIGKVEMGHRQIIE